MRKRSKRIKHRLALEAVSGLNWLTHQQDLAAKVLSDNLSALLCLEALGERDGQISEHTPTFIRSSTDALLKINRTRALPTSSSACRAGWARALRLPSMI